MNAMSTKTTKGNDIIIHDNLHFYITVPKSVIKEPFFTYN